MYLCIKRGLTFLSSVLVLQLISLIYINVTPNILCVPHQLMALDGNLLSPRIILILSGKRKSGKDYVAGALQQTFGPERCGLVQLSSPLKQEYARQHNLNYDLLLSSNSYKEIYRKDMIKWGEMKRADDPTYFCKAAARYIEKEMWIVTDARRPSDIKVMQNLHGKTNSTHILLIRIEAKEEIRKQRGWKFVSGVDDVDSECALDVGIEWDYIIQNNESDKILTNQLKEIISQVNKLLQ